MKKLIELRDNQDANFRYGAILIDASLVDEIQNEINEIMNYFYEHIMEYWDANTEEYVLQKLQNKYDFEYISSINFEVNFI